MPTPLPPDYFSPEYRRATSHKNPYWRILRKVTFAVTLGRDAVAIWWPATDCDHLHYKNLGKELPLRDVVGLNRRTHRVVTTLRRNGWSWPVNLVLRLAYLVWMTGWISVGTAVYHFVHVR